MGDLASRAEAGRLRDELGVGDDRLQFLHDHHHQDVRRLRLLVSESLAAPHRAAFRRLAGASSMLPAMVVAPIAERVFGPVLSSKVAAELGPDEARSLVGHFRAPFLADLCRTLDPTAAGDVVAAIPAERALEVGMELHRRGDLVTLGRFVDVVAEDAIPPMLGVLDDDALLQIALGADGRDRLDTIFRQLDDARVLDIVRAAAGSDQLADAVALLGELGPDQAVRTITLVIGAEAELLADLVATLSRVGGWDELLPVIARLEPADLEALVASPGLDRPELFAALARDVVDAGLGHEVVTVVGAMPEERQRQLAATLADRSPVLAGELLALVDAVDGAAALPAVAELTAALET